MTDPRTRAAEVVDEARESLVALSHAIHADPELAFEEKRASAWLAQWLTAAGFDVRRDVGGLETAVAGSFGPGPLHVAVIAEYDALPGVGHACGHNVIAAAAMGAGLALAAVAEEVGLKVTVFGTPAEEGGGGKITMLRAGAFEGVHAAMMVHPGPRDTLEPNILAVQTLEVAYTGREAHAAGAPELGINAADALVVAQVGIGLLRQHIPDGSRIHGIVTKGGDAPNIVPAHTQARFMVRAATSEALQELTARVTRCFEAGAVATGAQLEIESRVAYAHLVQDPDLTATYRAAAERLGRQLVPVEESGLGPISTDMGDVSLAVPSIHPMIGIESLPYVNHQPGFAAAAASAAADQAVRDGAVAMAWTAIDAATDQELRGRIVERAERMAAVRRGEGPSS